MLRDEWGLVPEGRAKFTRALELAGDGDDGLLIALAERAVHEAHASGEGALARRAQALLALDRGLSQVEAGRVAGLSDRRVRYWLARYRVEGTGIYDQEAVDPGATEPAAGTQRKKRPDISRTDTMTEAAAATLRFHLAKMLEHEEGTRLGEDPEELHDMRVSTRRMRMALRVFADYLDPDVMRPVLRGLRRTGRTLGAVRDLDVFNEKTQVYLDGLPDERAGDLDGLLDAWKAERDKQRERLVDYLDGKRYRRFVETTTELLEGPVEALAPQTAVAPRPQRVAQVLPGVLYKDMAVVWAFEGQIGGLGDAAAALPRPAQGVQGAALHAGVLRGRPRARGPAADQAGQGAAGPPRRPAGCGRDQRHPARLHHVGHVAPRGPRPSRAHRDHRGAGRGSLPRRAAGRDGASRAHLPRGLAEGGRHRLQPRPGVGDRGDLRPQPAARRGPSTGPGRRGASLRA